MDMTKQMGKEFMLGLYKELEYQTINKRSAVFNQGDIGRHFYIILRGSVIVLVNKDLQLVEGTQNKSDKQTSKT